MAYLELDGLVKSYGSVKAADNVSLDVLRGEFVTLLGPSGSGKTTLLMMVAGFVAPDSGRVVLDGQELTRVPPYGRNLGMVFQNYALFPHMTVFDNVAFALKMRKIDSRSIRQQVIETLAIVHLDGLEHRRPSQLSGGQQQRVSLARALVYRPRLLLMDEPLGALDKKLREAMQIELKHIQQQVGITVLSVTHDQEEALTLSDRVAVLNRGRLEQVGAAAELYENPKSRFVADFIGETNFLDITVTGVEPLTLEARCASVPRVVLPRVPGVSPGDRLKLSVRPEKLFFVESEKGLDCSAKGRVTEVIYMGDATKYYVQLEKSEVVVLKQHNRKGIRSPKVGDAVTVGWIPENSVGLFP